MGRIASIPARLNFSFLCLLPHRPLGHSSWSGAPNYTSRVTDENDPSRHSETSCALKRGTSTRSCFFSPGSSSLRPNRRPHYLPLFLPCSLSTSFLHRLPLKALCPWPGARGYFIHRMLFSFRVTWNFSFTLSLSLFLFYSVSVPLFIRELCFSFGLKCFWNGNVARVARSRRTHAWRRR